jgi:hypothetical protein
VSGVGDVLEQDMIDFNLLKNRNVDAPQVEICSVYGSQPDCEAQNGVCDSNIGSRDGDSLHTESVVHDSHTESQVDDSHAQSGMADSHTQSRAGDFHTESRVDSHIESGLGDSCAESGMTESHTESRACDTHIVSRVGDFHAESRVGDSHVESGVGNSHAESTVDDSHVESEVGDSHPENGAGDSHTESGVCDSHVESGVGDSHSWIGIRDPCSECGIFECSCSRNGIEGDLHSLYAATDSQSEAEILDVCQSSGRENMLGNTKLDGSVVAGLQSEEEENKKSQVPKRWRHRSSNSHVRGHFIDKSFSPIVTRSNCRLMLRNKKCAACRFADSKYPQPSHRARSRSKKENCNMSRQVSCRDIFVQNEVTKNIVTRNDRKVPPADSVSIASSPVVRKRYRSVDVHRQSPWKKRNRSFSWSVNTEQSALENASNSLIFTSECKDNMQTKSNTVITQECITENLDDAIIDASGVTVISNGSSTAQDLHCSDGMKMCYNNITTGVDRISLSSRILNHRPFSEVCMNDVVRIKAKALAARKFRPSSTAEILQRKMMKELQGHYSPD